MFFMKTPLDTYAAYRIMPGLQLHQLRVAAVGQFVCDSLAEPVDERGVILACLFHDMGNIIKSDLVSFPEFLEPHPRSYWEEVKREYIEKYGDQAHDATVAIMREMNLSEDVVALADGIGFSRLESVRDSESYELKVVQYADLRVAPYGVLPLEERLADSRVRYRDRRPWAAEGSEDAFARLSEAAREVERQIFSVCSITPDEVNDAAIEPIVALLKRYEV